MGRRLKLIGKRYGRLVVVGFIGVRNRRAYWECKCDCGSSKAICSAKLTSGTKSCGCLSVDMVKSRATHGESKNSKEYMIWKGIHTRCLNKNSKAYPRYGGRGVKVCERWLNSYENFLSDMGRKPSEMHTLERIDNDGNYEPSNCRWATYKEQGNNTRTNNYVSFNGDVKTLMQWSEILNMPYKSLWYRITVANWPIERAFHEPIKKWKN